MNKQNWIPTKVKDVAKIVSGATPKTGIEENWGGDIPWLTPKDLSDNPAPYTSHGSRFLTEQGFNSCSTHMLPKGTVLLTSRAPVGYVSVAANDICTNQGFKSLVLEDGEISEFWYYLLSANTETLLNYSGGSTFKELSKRSLEQIEFLIPPIEEQREIVSFMQALDLMIQAGDREIASAEQMRIDVRQILLRETEEQWGVTSIAEFTTFASGGAFPRKFQGKDSGEYPFFKVSDMNDPANYPSMGVSANWIDEDVRSELKAKIHPEGTVIFPKVGAALKTEKRRILERPSAFDNNIMGLIPTEDADSFYIFMAMENVELGPMSNPGPVPSVNQNTIRRVEIPAAPLEEQKKIVKKMQTLDTYIDSAKRSQEALKQVRQDALHALLSGDKDVRDLAEMFATNEDVA